MKSPLHLPSSELAILQILWGVGGATTREIAERLYGNVETSEYYTVQKLLERLEEKRCVSRDRSARTHVFSARIQRDDVVGDRLRDLADSLCEGSLTPLLTGLLNIRRLSDDELDTLRTLVGQIETRQGKKRRK